jgi:hypothetical protein
MKKISRVLSLVKTASMPSLIFKDPIRGRDHLKLLDFGRAPSWAPVQNLKNPESFGILQIPGLFLRKVPRASGDSVPPLVSVDFKVQEGVWRQTCTLTRFSIKYRHRTMGIRSPKTPSRAPVKI